MDNNNLVSLEKLRNVAREKGINKYIKEIGYSSIKNKKYYIKTIDNKKVDFGSSLYSDFLLHKDKDRRDKFRKRFKALYEKNKNNYNSPMFYSWNLLW